MSLVAQIFFHSSKGFFSFTIKKSISVLRWNLQELLIVHRCEKQPNLALQALCEIHSKSKACKHLPALLGIKG